MKYCCEGFQLAVKNVSKRGVSIGPKEHVDGKPYFILVMRSIDEDKITKVSSALGKIILEEPVDIYYATETVVKYCPWCGAKLSRYYKRTWRELEDCSLG